MPSIRKIQTQGVAALFIAYSSLFLMFPTMPQNLKEPAVSSDDSSLIFFFTIYVIFVLGLLFVCVSVVFIRGAHGRTGIHFLEARAVAEITPASAG